MRDFLRSVGILTAWDDPAALQPGGSSNSPAARKFGRQGD
jgi:hypothetical protein